MGLDRLRKQVDKEGRDLQILAAVVEYGPIGIVGLAEQTDVPEHKVRYSLRMLENDGLVEPTPQGAVPTEDFADRAADIDRGIDHLIERLEAIREDAHGTTDSTA